MPALVPARAMAQEVEVNTTILRYLPPPPEQSRFKPITLKPPPGAAPDAPQKIVAEPAPAARAQPVKGNVSPGFLTGNDDDDVAAPVAPAPVRQTRQEDALTPSGHPAVAAETPLGASPRPAYVGVRQRVVRRQETAPAPSVVPPPPAKPDMPPDAAAIFGQAVEFPVVMKMRTESSDPSLAETPAVAVPVPTPKPEQDAVPINADVVAAMAKQLSTPSAAAPPVPAPKPAYDKATKSAAAMPGEKVRIDAVKVPKATSTRVMATRINAPSMPAADVTPSMTAPVPGVGPVPPPRVNDHVMNKMMDMDKKRVMAGIEDAVKRTNNMPGRHVSDNDKLPVIHNGGGTTIVGAKHLMRETSRGNAIIKPGKDEPVVEGVSDGAASLKPEDKTASIQMPSPPPEADYAAPGYISIVYDKGELGLSDALQGDIRGKVLPLLKKDPAAKLQIQAFASDAGGSHNSRQRSLARGLAVREYLIGQGISQDRLDIHAMGMQSDRDPIDRVDFVVVAPAPTPASPKNL